MGSVPFCTACGLEVRVGEEWLADSRVVLLEDAPQRTFLRHKSVTTCLARLEKEAGRPGEHLRSIELRRARLLRAREEHP